ncbi:hemerythrin domain-containing protein [Actinospica sp. MGRD01-02]|uniref:Hemerythrin domain-containing protein n=1 Tax=Actinospica acidithermotolerans TaxID=2828514 RepID=A0A941EDF2_9ACTN|nr:hemerythrin domain-containing protein [Actinospica acidithermotolerans]MBR7830690.1 hemerythrin domain-containing protein [Actinospica acidithermotolerans]
MAVAHRAFRRQLAELPDLVLGVRPGNATRARLVVSAVRFALLGLEVHHLSEDEYLWPRLMQRATGQSEAIACMKLQHYRLDDLIAHVTGSLDDLAADPRQPLCEKVAA